MATLMPRVTTHPNADVNRYQVDALPGDDEYVTTTHVAGLAIYVRQGPSGAILVDVDHVTPPASRLVVSVDDVTYYNDEPTTPEIYPG